MIRQPPADSFCFSRFACFAYAMMNMLLFCIMIFLYFLRAYFYVYDMIYFCLRMFLRLATLALFYLLLSLTESFGSH